MVTTVTQKNMVAIPAEIGRKFGIKPGWRLDWQRSKGVTRFWSGSFLIAESVPSACWGLAGSSHRVAMGSPISSQSVRLKRAIGDWEHLVSRGLRRRATSCRPAGWKRRCGYEGGGQPQDPG